MGLSLLPVSSFFSFHVDAILIRVGLKITELSERPKMVNLGQTDTDLGDFMANNTGRLAAIFLKSFFP